MSHWTQYADLFLLLLHLAKVVIEWMAGGGS